MQFSLRQEEWLLQLVLLFTSTVLRYAVMRKRALVFVAPEAAWLKIAGRVMTGDRDKDVARSGQSSIHSTSISLKIVKL